MNESNLIFEAYIKENTVGVESLTPKEIRMIINFIRNADSSQWTRETKQDMKNILLKLKAGGIGQQDPENFEDGEPHEMSDVEADADALGSAGMGEDEYYGPGASEIE